jgi:hypothetical protein
MATQVFEVVIHMPQHEVASDGGLRDHQIWQRDGDPLPPTGIPQAGCRFPDPVNDGNLRQDSQCLGQLSKSQFIAHR